MHAGWLHLDKTQLLKDSEAPEIKLLIVRMALWLILV